MEDKQQKQDWQIGKLVRVAIAISLAGPALASLLAIYSIHSTQVELGRGTSDYSRVIEVCTRINNKLVAQEEMYFKALDELDTFARVDTNKLSEEIDAQVAVLGEIVGSLGDEGMQEAFDNLSQTNESHASGIHESLKTVFKTRDPSSVDEQVDANIGLMEDYVAQIKDLKLASPAIFQTGMASLEEKAQGYLVLSIGGLLLAIGLATYFTFVTSRKLEKQVLIMRDLEDTINTTQKMDSVGQLSAGLAHEINTPLQYISDYSYFLGCSGEQFNQLRKETRDFLIEELFAHLPEDKANAAMQKVKDMEEDHSVCESEKSFLLAQEQVESGIARISTIVRSMRDLTDKRGEELQVIPLADIITSSLALTTNACRFAATVEVPEIPQDAMVRVAPAEMIQVFISIIQNAVDAISEMQKSGRMPEGPEYGKISIKLSVKGGKVYISFQDNGPGIPDDIKQKIFDPFFTTKDVGAGTGQGLSTALRMVRNRHGGDIRCVSKVGVGTTFILTLPNTEKIPPESFSGVSAEMAGT